MDISNNLTKTPESIRKIFETRGEFLISFGNRFIFNFFKGSSEDSVKPRSDDDYHAEELTAAELEEKHGINVFERADVEFSPDGDTVYFQETNRTSATYTRGDKNPEYDTSKRASENFDNLC